jgi:hypothetical protein
MKIVISSLISIILFFWYIDVNSYHKQEKHTKKNYLTWEEAKEKIVYPNPKYEYYFEEESFVSITKTLIPFKYNEKIIGRNKVYKLIEI